MRRKQSFVDIVFAPKFKKSYAMVSHDLMGKYGKS
jgi:hypothetical protein